MQESSLQSTPETSLNRKVSYQFYNKVRYKYILPRFNILNAYFKNTIFFAIHTGKYIK